MQRYIVVAGNMLRCYTGTLACTGLNIVGRYDTKEEMDADLDRLYEEHSGVLLCIDLETGEAI